MALEVSVALATAVAVLFGVDVGTSVGVSVGSGVDVGGSVFVGAGVDVAGCGANRVLQAESKNNINSDRYRKRFMVFTSCNLLRCSYHHTVFPQKRNY
jgi:hypothetical protein